MTAFTWMHDGKKAGDRTLDKVLSSARASKLERMTQIREELLVEGQQFADDRELMNQVRRRWRIEEQDRRRLEAELRRVGAAVRKAAREAERKPLYVFARPLKGREITGRENKAFDALVGLPTPSVTKKDGLSSFHCKFTSRGLGERRDRWRPYNPGEAVKHLRYIIRESARELGQGGVVSNVSLDPDELAGFFAAVEHLEYQDRDNAHVYTSLVISLPHELTPKGRERLLAAICDEFVKLELPYVGVLHAPDPGRDQRNFHTHIMFSLRPFENLGGGNHVFSPDKYSDLNDETFIRPFRHKVATLMNEAMEREGHGRRFTALSDADRGLAPRSKRSGKRTIGESNRKRKQEQLTATRAELSQRLRLRQAFERIGKLATPLLNARARDYVGEAAATRAAVLGAMEILRDRIVATQARVERDLARASAAVAAAGGGAAPTPAGGAQQQAAPDPQKAGAVAEAAEALLRTPYPRQRRIGETFQLVPPNVGALQDAELFEAESEIQRAHQAKWAMLLEELGHAIDAAPRSPFFYVKGKLRLSHEHIPGGLHAWYHYAASDSDIVDLIKRWELEWQKREERKKAAAEEAERKRKRRQKEREANARELVRRLEPRVLHAAPGHLGGDIKGAIATIAQAAIEARLILQVGTTEKAYLFERGEDRAALIYLKRIVGGEELVGKLARIVDPSEFTARKPVVLTLPVKPPAKKSGASRGLDRHVDRDGPER